MTTLDLFDGDRVWIGEVQSRMERSAWKKVSESIDLIGSGRIAKRGQEGVFKILDLEGGRLMEEYRFSTMTEVLEQLRNFHSIDCADAEDWSLLECVDIGHWAVVGAV